MLEPQDFVITYKAINLQGEQLDRMFSYADVQENGTFTVYGTCQSLNDVKEILKSWNYKNIFVTVEPENEYYQRAFEVGTVKKITEEDYNWSFNCLPPARYFQSESTEAFLNIECVTGKYYYYYLKKNNSYYRILGDKKQAYSELFELIKDYEQSIN